MAGMECYFGSFLKKNGEVDAHDRLVCFSIPDAGIVFKAPFSGGELHTDYASLLTLLEFVELNGKLFEGKDLRIYGDNLDLVKEVNETKPVKYEFSDLLRKALDYKKRYKFSLGWVPRDENPSIGGIFH